MIEVPLLLAKLAVLSLLLAAPLGAWQNHGLTWVERVLCAFLYPIMLAGAYAGIILVILALGFLLS